MNELIVHIGARKAASTTIQAVVVRNRAALAGRGILYALDERDNHHKIGHALEGRLDRAEAERLLTKVRMTVLASDMPRILMSYEGFAYGRRAPGFFAELARAAGRRLRVVAVVRKPADYLNSFYAHQVAWLREGRTFGDFAAAALDMPDIHYAALFRDWQDVADGGFVALPLGVPGRDVALEFLTALGLPDGEETRRLARHFAKNTARSPASIEVLRRISVGLPRDSLMHMRWPIGNAVRRACLERGWLGGGRFYGVTPAVAAAVAARTGESADRFARRVWGCDFAGVFADHDRPARPANAIDPAALAPDLDRDFQAVAEGVLADVAGGRPSRIVAMVRRAAGLHRRP